MVNFFFFNNEVEIFLASRFKIVGNKYCFNLADFYSCFWVKFKKKDLGLIPSFKA